MVLPEQKGDIQSLPQMAVQRQQVPEADAGVLRDQKTKMEQTVHSRRRARH